MSLLPQAAGYATIVGGGVVFAVIINALTHLQRRYTLFDPTRVEEFSSASRSVKTGLLAVGVTSAWVWAAVFLQTGTLTYLGGVSLPWWFGCGGFIEIAAFAFVTAKVKVNAGGAATYLQVARARFGRIGHLTFMLAALIANLVVSSEILVGGSGVVAGLTGISSYAAVWLFPLVITAYTLTGGLRATFIADYLHIVILLVSLLVLVLGTYTRGAIKSPGHLWELLKEAGELSPAVGNHEGSYLTFRSDTGMYYILIGTLGYYGLSQRAIAARPEGTSKAFAVAGLVFFTIAFATGSSTGLAARALQNSPSFPTYPEPLNAAQIGAGLAGPFASKAILGNAGPVMYLLIAFMATTSAFSAQLVAVSTLVTYDGYKQYIRPNATNQELMRVNHAAVIGWALFMAGLSSVWVWIGLDLNFLFYLMAVATSGAVVPVGLTMCWSGLNTAGAVAGAWSGLIVGLVAWLVTAAKLEGALNTATLTSNRAILAGALCALGTGAIVSIALSLIAPANFDFEITRHINKVSLGPTDVSEKQINAGDGEKEDVKSPVDEVDAIIEDKEYQDGVVKLQASQWKFRILTLSLLFIFYLLIPVPLAATGYIYSKQLLTLQLVAAIFFLFVSTLVMTLWPILESRKEIVDIFRRFRSNKRLDVAPAQQE
ncbi:hypothetical protein JCM8547_002616 [Rhodosporidiobolus lusitaniae]